MRLTGSTGLLFMAMVLAGCSSSANQLSAEGEQVRFVNEQPSQQCHYLGSVTGEQSNWLSGQQVEGGSSLRGAANNLRNRAANMGGNVIYNASTPSLSFISNFIPVSTKMVGQVYHCRELTTQ